MGRTVRIRPALAEPVPTIPLVTLLRRSAVVIALLVGQIDTAVIVVILIFVNVTLGTRQELATQASVQALQTQQIPSALVLRDGALATIESTALVPGDVLKLECEAIHLSSKGGRIKTVAKVEDKVAVDAEIGFALVDKGDI